MFTCDTADTAENNCNYSRQSNVPVCSKAGSCEDDDKQQWFRSNKDEQDQPIKPAVQINFKTQPEIILHNQLNIIGHDDSCGDINNCRSSSPNQCSNQISVLHSSSSSTLPVASSVMVSKKCKRRKKYRREYKCHNKRIKSCTNKEGISYSITSEMEEEAPASISPKVTPIFVWTSVDDTKIVRVLCEDYDKRNRIRLTRTASGWRSIPLIESLEKRWQEAASSSPNTNNSQSPELVHNSVPIPDNRLQTDNLSSNQTKNEYTLTCLVNPKVSNIIEDVDLAISNSNSLCEKISSPLLAKDDAFSSDEERQQENLRCIINKMQTDSLNSDEECEPLNKSSYTDSILNKLPHNNNEVNVLKNIFSIENNIASVDENAKDDDNIEETATSLKHLTAQKSIVNNYLDESSNINSSSLTAIPNEDDIFTDVEKLISSHHSTVVSENIVNNSHSEFEESNCNIISDTNISNDISVAEGGIVDSSSITTLPSKICNYLDNNFKDENSNSICPTTVNEGVFDNTEQHFTTSPKHDNSEGNNFNNELQLPVNEEISSNFEDIDTTLNCVSSPENVSLLDNHCDNFIDKNSKILHKAASKEKITDEFEETFHSSEDLILPENFPKNISNCTEKNNRSSVKQLEDAEILASSKNAKHFSPSYCSTSPKEILHDLTKNLIDSNSNIISGDVEDNTPNICCKDHTSKIFNDHLNASFDANTDSNIYSNNWVDNNSNIVCQSNVSCEIFDKTGETASTFPISHTPNDISNDYSVSGSNNNSNFICETEINESNHTDETEKLTASQPTNVINNDTDIYHALTNKNNDGSSSPSSLHIKSNTYRHKINSENSILSSLLQADIIKGKHSFNLEEEVDKKSTTLKCEKSPLTSSQKCHFKSHCIENSNPGEKIFKESSSNMELLYRSYFPKCGILHDNNDKNFLQPLAQQDNSETQCIDLSIQGKDASKINPKYLNMAVSKLVEHGTEPHNENNALVPNMSDTDDSINLQKNNRRGLYLDANYRGTNVKTESIIDDDTDLHKKCVRVDSTVLKVPLCQTLKSSSKCTNSRRLHVRRRSEVSAIADHTFSASIDDPPSTDIKPNNDQNITISEAALPPLFYQSSTVNNAATHLPEKCPSKSVDLLKCQPCLTEFSAEKLGIDEKEKAADPFKLKSNIFTPSFKERITSLDPLEQLKNVLSNPLYSVPDPLLVPKARLSALVTCPGREIPRLLSRRAKNLSYFSILSDPDMLVVSLSHLRSLMTKPLNETEIQEYQKRTEEIRTRLRLELLHYEANLENASIFASGGGTGSWNEYLSTSPTSVHTSKGITGSKIGAEDAFRGMNLAYTPTNLCFPADLPREISGSCGLSYPFEKKGHIPWSSDMLSMQKLSAPIYDPCGGIMWNADQQLCAHLPCYQTTPGTCAMSRNDLLYCPCDNQLRDTFPPYLHSALSCPSSFPMLRDFGAKNCLPEFCYPWMDIGRCVSEKGHPQVFDNPFEQSEYLPKASQPLAKCGSADLKVESISMDERDKVTAVAKVQPKDAKEVSDDRRSHSVEPKIKVRQHLVDPNRRPLLLNTRSPYEDSSLATFLRPWSNEGVSHSLLIG